MEKYVKTIPKFVYEKKQTGFEEIVEFVANDGKVFKTKEECEKYESDLRLQSANSKLVDVKKIPEAWFLAKDEDELEFLKRRLGFYSADKYTDVGVLGELEVNEWFGRDWDDWGDSGETITFISLKYAKENFNKFLEELSDETIKN